MFPTALQSVPNTSCPETYPRPERSRGAGGGNPKCWAEGEWTYQLCCAQPPEISDDCWIWPYSRGFCCEAPLPPRPPVQVGGLPRPGDVPPMRRDRPAITARCAGLGTEAVGEAVRSLMACRMSLDEIGALFETAAIGSGDKASGWHDYLGAYERLLLHLPLSATVLEAGVRSEALQANEVDQG